MNVKDVILTRFLFCFKALEYSEDVTQSLIPGLIHSTKQVLRSLPQFSVKEELEAGFIYLWLSLITEHPASPCSSSEAHRKYFSFHLMFEKPKVTTTRKFISQQPSPQFKISYVAQTRTLNINKFSTMYFWKNTVEIQFISAWSFSTRKLQPHLIL